MKRIAFVARIAATATVASLCALAAPAAAQEAYPAREVKVVCAFPPGSGADVWVRFFAEQARPFMKVPMLVDNKPGASGLIATTFTARSKPDGYTIFIHSPTSLAANYFMFKDKPIDPSKAMVTVATLLDFTFYLTASTTKTWKSVKELVEYSKQRGDKVSFATTSPPGQLMGALFKELFELKAVEVPYRTGPDTVNDYKSGALDFGFHDGVFAHAQQRAGNLRILAVGSKKRMSADPDVPTLDESGAKGADVPGFFGVMVPAGTPKPVVDKLNKVFMDVVALPQTQAFIKKFGGDPIRLSADDAQKRFLQSFDDWGRLIKLAKIQPKG